MSSSPMPQEIVDKIKIALDQLDNETVGLEGHQLKPSQCYRLELDPVHVLFNTNCPDTLKDRVQAILQEHVPPPSS